MHSGVLKIIKTITGVTVILFLAILSVYAKQPKTSQNFNFICEYWTSTASVAQLYFDVGHGYAEKDSVRTEVLVANVWHELEMELPVGQIQRLRFDPAIGAGKFKLRNLRIVGPHDKIVQAIATDRIRAGYQIESLLPHGNELEIRTVENANDPELEIQLDPPFSTESPLITIDSANDVAKWTVIWAALIGILFFVSRAFGRISGQPLTTGKAQLFVWLFAIGGTVLNCAPIIFLNKSFVSPEYGALLFYDRCPTLPNYSNCPTEDLHGNDFGAMPWSFFPLEVADEVAIKQYHEFPLWNRYNSAGVTLIGQGQMMLGDPLSWAIRLIGVEAWSIDAKFVILRALFAGWLGLCVLLLTRRVRAAALVAFVAPFVGFFLWRVNHTASFSLCYAPLILLAWFGIIYRNTPRARVGWLIGLTCANWLMINSGTVKEAYMALLVLNIIGAAQFFFERKRFGEQWTWWVGALIGSGICFAMIAAPLLGTFYAALSTGVTNYDTPQANQLPIGTLFGFIDNWFYLKTINGYYPAVNILFLVGVTIAVKSRFASIRERAATGLESTRGVATLTFGCLALIAIVFGIIPGSWITAIPFIKNIIHIHNTFSAVLVVPFCILGGIGFAQLEERTGLGKYVSDASAVIAVVVFVAALCIVHYSKMGKPDTSSVVIYSGVALLIALVAPWLMSRFTRGLLSYSGVALCVLAACGALARTAMYTETRFDDVLFRPLDRVALTVRPGIVDTLIAKMNGEPFRVIGMGDALIPGYNATLGLETISGPDAVMNREYRELVEAMQMPYGWVWRMIFDRASLAGFAKQLDFLAVGAVLSSARMTGMPQLEYIADDGRMFAYKRNGAWPRAFFADRVEVIDQIKALAQRIAAGNGRPFVAVDSATIQSNPVLQPFVDESQAGLANIIAARDYRLTANTTEFSIDAPAAGVVYLGETNEPSNFLAYVDAKPVSYLPANSAFKAIVVDKAGTYRVRFSYWPVHLSLYLYTALAGVVLWLAMLLRFWSVAKSWPVRAESIDSLDARSRSLLQSNPLHSKVLRKIWKP